MNSAVQSFVSQVFQALSTLSPFAKAVSVAATALVSSLVNMAFAGSFDTTSIVVLGAGVVSSIIAYLVPNTAKPTPPAAKKVASVVPANK